MVVKLSLVPACGPCTGQQRPLQRTPCGQVRWPLHHGQEGHPGHPGHPPCSGERQLIWRETGRRWLTGARRDQGTAFPSPPQSSRGNKTGTQLGIDTMERFRWLRRSNSLWSILISRNTGQNSEYIPVLSERNVLAPGVVAPVPLQWSMSGQKRIKYFYGDRERMSKWRDPPPEPGLFNQAVEFSTHTHTPKASYLEWWMAIIIVFTSSCWTWVFSRFYDSITIPCFLLSLHRLHWDLIVHEI